jgi:hypothetical protein
VSRLSPSTRILIMFPKQAELLEDEEAEETAEADFAGQKA